MYTPEYDLGGGHWPHFHNRVVTSLILAQIVLILVLLLRYVIVVTILLVPLPLVTYLYNTTYITAAYERTFSFYALEVIPEPSHFLGLGALKGTGSEVLRACLHWTYEEHHLCQV